MRVFQREWMVPEVKIEKKEKKETLNDLTWKPVDYTSAKVKFRFRIYSMRVGSNSKYTISQEPPRGFWTELNDEYKPSGITFEETKSKDFQYCRLLKHSIPEHNAIIKIPRQ